MPRAINVRRVLMPVTRVHRAVGCARETDADVRLIAQCHALLPPLRSTDLAPQPARSTLAAWEKAPSSRAGPLRHRGESQTSPEGPASPARRPCHAPTAVATLPDVHRVTFDSTRAAARSQRATVQTDAPYRTDAYCGTPRRTPLERCPRLRLDPRCTVPPATLPTGHSAARASRTRRRHLGQLPRGAHYRRAGHRPRAAGAHTLTVGCCEAVQRSVSASFALLVENEARFPVTAGELPGNGVSDVM